MSNFTGKVGRRAVALAAVSTLALGVTACGDDSSDATGASSSKSASRSGAPDTHEYYMRTGKDPELLKDLNITGTPEKTDPKTPYDVLAIINPSTLLVKNQQGGDAFFVHMINTIKGKSGTVGDYSPKSEKPTLPASTDEQIAEITNPKNYGSVSTQRYVLAEALAKHDGVVYLEEDPTITEQAIRDSDQTQILKKDGDIPFRLAYVWFNPDDERSGNFASSLNGILLENSNAQCSHPDHYGFQSEIWRAQTNPDEYDLSTEQCGDVPAYYEIGEPVHGRNVNKDASDFAKKRAAERGITDNWGDELWGLDMTEESYHLVGTKYRKQADELAKIGYDKYDKAVRSKQSTE